MSEKRKKKEPTPEQRMAIEWKGGELLVGAAAGGGKTTVLVDRFVHLVRNGLGEPENIPVLTFTDKASVQLKTRIRQKLDELPDGARLVRKLDIGYILTIHGFCRKLLKENYHLADLDPSFLLISGEESKLLKLRAVDEIFEDVFIGDEGEELREQLRALCAEYGGARFDNLAKSYILNTYDWLMRQTDPDKILDSLEACEFDPPTEHPLYNEYHDIAREKIDVFIREAALLANWRYDKKNSKDFETYSVRIDEMLHEVDSIKGKDVFTDLRGIKASFDRLKLPRKSVRTPDELNAAVKFLREGSFKDLRDILEPGAGDPVGEMRIVGMHIATIAKMTRIFRQRYVRLKERRWGLDFDDLQHRAMQMLTHHQEVAEQYRERFRYLLIDEYQDNNNVQDEIIRNVCSTENIFMVGDSKQAIYRFRGAEPRVFTRTEKRLLEGGKEDQAVWLERNFRSVPAICNGINGLMSQLFTGGVSEIDYATGHALKADRGPIQGNQPEVELAIFRPKGKIEVDEEGDENIERYLSEADWVADRIKEIVGNEEVTLEKDGSSSKASYGDIVILLRSRKTTAAMFSEALKRKGIPYHLTSAGGFLESQEIRDIRNLLRIIDNPLQDIPFASVLNSPVVGITPDELYRVKLAFPEERSLLDAVTEALKGKNFSVGMRDRLAEFTLNLTRWRESEPRMSPAEILLRIYRDTSYREYVLGLDGGLAAKDNLDYFVEMARSAVPKGEGGVRRLVSYLDEIEEGTMEPVFDRPGEGIDAVRIMTIHAAKGLEFPVVFVSALGRRFNWESISGDFLLDDEFGPVLKFSDSSSGIVRSTCAHLAAKDRLRAHEKAEELRILYVAISRAMDKLILTGSAELSSVVNEMETVEPGMDPRATSPMKWLLPIISRMEGFREAVDRLDQKDTAITTELKNPDGSVIHLTIPPVSLETTQDEQVSKADSVLERIAHYKRLEGIRPSLPDHLSPIASQYEHEWASMLSDKINAGGLGSSQDGGRIDEFPLDRFPDWPESADDAREIGILLHKAFEIIDFNSLSEPGWAEREAGRIIESMELSDEWGASKLSSVIEGLRSKPLGDIFRDDVEILKEQAFLLKIPVNESDTWIMLQGRMDLVLIHNTTAYLIDFKSDSINEEYMEARAGEYVSQMAAYGRVLRDIRGFDVRSFIYFIRHARYIELTEAVNDFDLHDAVIKSARPEHVTG